MHNISCAISAKADVELGFAVYMDANGFIGFRYGTGNSPNSINIDLTNLPGELLLVFHTHPGTGRGSGRDRNAVVVYYLDNHGALVPSVTYGSGGFHVYVPGLGDVSIPLPGVSHDTVDMRDCPEELGGPPR